MLAAPQDRLFIAPGAHPALLGILGILAKAGDVILSESLAYPGTRSIAAQSGLRHVGLPMDDDGVDAEAFADACKRLSPRALYRHGARLFFFASATGASLIAARLPLFNGRGQPSHVRGVTPVPGACFLGLPWLYTWSSGRFSGIARDAEYLAEHIKARRGLVGAERRQVLVNEAAIGS